MEKKKFNHIAVRSIRMSDGSVIAPGKEVPLLDGDCKTLLADGLVARKTVSEAVEAEGGADSAGDGKQNQETSESKSKAK